MVLPTISKSDISTHFPQVTDIAEPLSGGQKLVFPCRIAGDCFVLKIMSSDMPDISNNDSDTRIDEVFERARREVAILQSCECASLPKIGPIPLTRFPHGDQSLILFSEEYIDGASLDTILSDDGPLDDAQTIALGEHLCAAVSALWEHRKIHRDIKPQNIMRRSDNSQFVLLDPGIAFDLNDNSLTSSMVIPHTPGYLAPELTNLARKRDADCRSDFFLIGIVLYFARTGRHPFLQTPHQAWDDVIRTIVSVEPQAPREVQSEISDGLSDLIMRLLAKRKHARYRNVSKLRAALTNCRESLEQ